MSHKNIATDIEQTANYDPAFRLLDAVTFELSLDDGFTWAQPEQARAFFGAELPKTIEQFISGIEAAEPRLSAQALKALLPGAQGRWSMQRRVNGRLQYYDIITERSHLAQDGEDLFIGVIRNITQLHLKYERSEQRANQAHTLGCLNETDFKIQLDLMSKLASSHCPKAVEISFKLKDRERVVRFYGQHVNTHIEYELLRRLIAFLPQAASIARGHEKLLCLLPDVSKIDAESLSQALTAFPIATPEGPASVQLDVDIRRLANDESETRGAIKSAPTFAPAPIITEDDILGLLNQRSLSLALQPVCEAHDGSLHHYEALMRIDDPLKGPQSAWRHIIAAEELGLVHLLDQRSLERAALLMLRYPDIHIALNVSVGTIGDIEKQDDYMRHLDAYPGLHSRFSFEMTETMALEQPELAAQFAERLRARDCYLSIDDFGAGHTSFETLMITEARQIKLDGSLIEGVCRSSDKQNFVRLMVDFAHTFEVKLVAERVETVQEQRLLTALGVDYLQGYYLGRPISEHEFTGRMDMPAKI